MSKGRYQCTWCREDHYDGCVNLACPVGYHNVRSMHPEDLDDERDADPLVRAKGESYELGRVGHAERIPAQLAEMAGTAFSRGDDKKAYLLRELKDEFAKVAEKMRSEWSAEYRPERLKP